MMRLRNPDLRIRTSGLLASVHERNHACEVGLIRQQLQVVHQLGMRLESVGNACGPRHVGHLFRILLLGLLQSPLDVANRSHVVVDFRLIRRTEPLLELSHTIGDGIENAPILA